MRYENKFWERHGQVFSMKNATIDLSDVRVLHCGVDTLKQLFDCSLLADRFLEISQSESGSVLNLGGIDWRVAKSGKQSGYQYILSNRHIGFVVLLKSFYVPADQIGGHLKIDVSPQVLYENSPAQVDDQIMQIARIFARDLSRSGIAAHIAVDAKGLVIPEDFEQRLVAKARRRFKVQGISNVEFDGMNEMATVYGNAETYTFGSVSAVQFCTYDKAQEAIKGDKLDFWESIWRQTGSVDDPFLPEYQHGDDVRRIELRFHHTVIREFENGTVNGFGENIIMRSFEQLSRHLTALWQYGLTLFRLQYSSSYIDPLWQLLIEDIRVVCDAPDFMYKRAKKQPGVSSRRNVAFWLGNMIRLCVRRHLKVQHIVANLLSSGLESEIADYLGFHFTGNSDVVAMALTELIERKYQDLTLQGVAA